MLTSGRMRPEIGPSISLIFFRCFSHKLPRTHPQNPTGPLDIVQNARLACPPGPAGSYKEVRMRFGALEHDDGL